MDPQDSRNNNIKTIRKLGDQFLASLNHDIRTPLSGILGMTDLLEETELSPEQREYVSTTRLCADQLLEMVNAALEYTALISGNVELERAEYYLPEALETTVNEFRPKAESKGLAVECRVEDSVPDYVVGDAVRLRQTLAPLLANAVKFTAHGRIAITATASAATTGSATLVVTVQDTGIGIARNKLKIIFDSFRQLESGLSRTYAGMGLGLAVARRLAEMMGGNIAVESEPGSGSTFYLTLPLELPPPRTEPAGDSAAVPEAAVETRPRILFVDDNDVARRIVTHILRRANYDIHCASGGREGIEAAAAIPFDLILMDLQMPVVNGLEATTAIRSLPAHRQTPILALSANYSDDFKRTCRSAGLDDFLTKPIQKDQLLTTVAHYLNR